MRAGVEMENNRWQVRYSIYFVLLTALTLAICKKIYDNDIWYHLTIGREIFTTLKIPATEFFVYPLLGEPTSFHEWGFAVFYYALYRWLGFAGMSLANGLMGALTLLLFFVAAKRQNWHLPALLLAPLFWLVDFRLMYRPEMFFFIFLALEIYFLERYSVEKHWKWLYFLLPLGMCLNHFHPSAFFLLVVVGAYCVQFILEQYRRDGKLSQSLVGKLLGIFAATLLLSGVNPYGFQQTLLPLKFVQSTEYLQLVGEFVPTFQTPLKVPYIIVVITGLIALIFQRQRRIADWLLFLFFGYLGVRYNRNVAIFALTTYIPVARTISEQASRFPALSTKMARNVGWSCVAIAMSATIFTVTRKETWGIGVLADRFPEKAASIISGLQPSGRLFNSYDSGGYFAWRLYDRYLVSIDGRHYTMDKSFVENNQVFQTKKGWQNVLAGYQVSTIFTPATSPYTGVLVDLLAYLDEDEGWVLVSAEPSGLLYTRKEALLSKLPGWRMPDQNLAWWQVIKEAEQITVAPGRADAYLSMSIAYFHLHKLNEAAGYLRKYIQLTPGDLEAAKSLALFEQGGRFDPAPSSKYRVF
jgi:hypothetical protein